MTRSGALSRGNSPPWLRRGGRDIKKNVAKPLTWSGRGGSFKKMNFLTSTTPATFLEASPYRARPSVRHPSSAEEGNFARKIDFMCKAALTTLDSSQHGT
jgi:hypothetical protein